MHTPRFSPAADRNKQPILDALRAVLPPQGHALEIASGTGQHAAWFASHLPHWTWQPTDATPGGFADIKAYSADLSTVHKPQLLDVMQTPWLDADTRFDAIYCANMLHISPWETTPALMRGSAAHLTASGMLITYGPYLQDSVATAEGNLNFDESLRAQNPAWGIRRLEDVVQIAAQAGLQLTGRHTLPANNLLLVWQRTTAESPALTPSVFIARTTPDNLQVDASSEDPLLLSLEMGGSNWPSSCRNGVCRTCLGQLISGSVRYTVEWPGLSAEEQAGGYVLPCVAHPCSDVVLRQGY